jgi:hypothetical protein
MVHLPHLGKLRREVKEEAVDADDDDVSAGAGAEASPFHKRSRLAQHQQPPPSPQVGFPVASFVRRSSDDWRNFSMSTLVQVHFLHRDVRNGRSCSGGPLFYAWVETEQARLSNDIGNYNPFLFGSDFIFGSILINFLFV